MKLRTLTRQGRNEFIGYIARVGQNPSESPPIADLSVEPYSLEYPVEVSVPEAIEGNRLEMARTLAKLFEAHSNERGALVNAHDMWTWLSLVWFDLLCPATSSGVRAVRDQARYVCSSDYTDYYRHLLAGSWNLFSLHGENARLMLCTPIHVHSDFVEQVASRQDIVANQELVRLMDLLYWDSKKGCPKTGAQSKDRPGNLRRLIDFAHQLELTYDVFSMTRDDIRGLLPREFRAWM